MGLNVGNDLDEPSDLEVAFTRHVKILRDAHQAYHRAGSIFQGILAGKIPADGTITICDALQPIIYRGAGAKNFHILLHVSIGQAPGEHVRGTSTHNVSLGP